MTEPPENEAPPIPTKKPEAKANSGPNIADSLGPANSFPVQCASHGADGITRTERQDLLRLHRQAVKVAKIAVAQRGDSLRADFEQQLASIYSFNQDPVWKKAYHDAEEVVAEAQRHIAERCRALNIRERFAPRISVSWYGRGENAVRERRTELRRVAYSRIEQLEKTALQEIERRSLSAQTVLLASGLNSIEAKQLLEGMSSVEGLMPNLAVTQVEQLLEDQSQRRKLL
jgi:hypothetical protein